MTGAILLVLGLVVATGVDVNMWQAPIAAVLLLVGAAWIQGMSVWAFVRKMFAAEESAQHESIRHRGGNSRSYGQAAIFLGGACLFTGTITDCEEMADDLWHYGQQAEVKLLDGTEMQFDVL